MIDRHSAVTRAYPIPGQTWPSELCWLYDNLGGDNKIHVEVGVYCGRSLFTSCASMTRSRVYAVDLWSVGDDEVHPERQWVESVRSATIEAIVKLTSNTVVSAGIGSLAMSKSVSATVGKVDSVFIDADHNYESIYGDIEAWMPLVKPGGLICGHDYSTQFPGVMDAVNYLVPNFEVVPKTRIWFARL